MSGEKCFEPKNDNNWMYQKYIIEKLSITKIAGLCSCCQDTVYRKLKKFNIPIRSKSEAMKGVKFSKIHKENIGKARKRYLSVDKNKEYLRNIWLGKIHTKETKNKISQTKKGKCLSDEHRRKISLALGGDGSLVNSRNEYVLVFDKKRRRHVLEHRLIVENSIGRLLKSEEHIHHKNRIKKDNRLENLEIVSCKQHIAYHYPNKYRKCENLNG